MDAIIYQVRCVLQWRETSVGHHTPVRKCVKKGPIDPRTLVESMAPPKESTKWHPGIGNTIEIVSLVGTIFGTGRWDEQ